MTHDGETRSTPHRDLGGPERAGRLLAQRTHFAGPTPKAPDDLYCLVEKGVAVRQRGRLRVHGYARATTNTYFGRFPASYWQAGRASTASGSTPSCPVAGYCVSSRRTPEASRAPSPPWP